MQKEIIILKKECLNNISIGYLYREGYDLYLDTPEKNLITLIRG